MPPERYLYEEEESDSENYPPYIADSSTGWGWRSVTSPTFSSVADTNAATVLPNPPDSIPPPSLGPTSAVARDGFDGFVNVPPSVPEDQPASQPWGISPPSPTLALRTRTGRTGRWSSVGRPFPSLSSGLGGTIHDDRPMSPISFYDRQLMVASEREIRDEDVAIVDSGTDNPASTQGEGSTLLDPDGEMVAWGSSTSDIGTESRNVSDTDGEYKPSDYFFDR